MLSAWPNPPGFTEGLSPPALLPQNWRRPHVRKHYSALLCELRETFFPGQIWTTQLARPADVPEDSWHACLSWAIECGEVVKTSYAHYTLTPINPDTGEPEKEPTR